MVWRQAWDSGTNYSINDAVQYNGASYISIQAGIGQTPDAIASAFWSLLADKGATGAAGPAGADGAQGPQGPQGPQGVAGAQGPQGPAGADGAAGAQGPTGPAGMVWRQAWDSGTNYSVNDAVQYNGASYISIQAGIGQTPDTIGSTFWSLLADKGATGAAGAAGADGAQGPEGPQGPQGVAGAQGPQGVQ